MLESPQDETVVRWGNEGDSFVVLEACVGVRNFMRLTDGETEREVHKTHTSEALQAQQLRQLRTPAEQV